MSDMSDTSHGQFSRDFAERKNWKLDEKLLMAIARTIRESSPRNVTVADLGAGVGRYVRALRDMDIDCIGYDGIDGIGQLSGYLVRQVDLTSLDCDIEPVDCVICIEVGEHIPLEYELVFLRNVSKAAKAMLICSWAIVNQRGRDHVNCRMPEYVANQLGRLGWELDHDATLNIRQEAGKGWDKKLMVFVSANL